jgi:hypothetical protein
MNSRRGMLFFWIVQILLVPALACFVATSIMHFGHRSKHLWELGAAMALVQIPFTALCLVFTFAAATGELLPRPRIRFMYLEIVAAALMIALVFLWRGVYRVF